MSWFGGNSRKMNLEKLREVLARDLQHASWALAKHVTDGWFLSVGSKADWRIPDPYDGWLLLTRIAEAPDNSRNGDKLLLQLSLIKNTSGKCNFPRSEVIKLAKNIEEAVGVRVFPDFSALPNGYTGETSDVAAFERWYSRF